MQRRERETERERTLLDNGSRRHASVKMNTVKWCDFVHPWISLCQVTFVTT
jgi:hypothetical protein